MKSMKSIERTESLRLREGGDTRPDQTQDDTSSGQAKRHDIIQGLDQFSHQQQREQLKGKAPMTAEQELREQAIHSRQDRIASLDTAEERRGLPPSTENHLPLGLHPERFPGVGGCRDCVFDSLAIASLHIQNMSYETEIIKATQAKDQTSSQEEKQAYQNTINDYTMQMAANNTAIATRQVQIATREADPNHR